jgi:hypothetical protein
VFLRDLVVKCEFWQTCGQFPSLGSAGTEGFQRMWQIQLVSRCKSTLGNGGVSNCLIKIISGVCLVRNHETIWDRKGILPQYLHLQDKWSVKAPPMSGPATEAIPYIAPTIPTKIGRRTRGTVREMIITPPLKTPADPSPAIAWPTIKTFDVGATPQSSDPNSKSAIVPLIILPPSYKKACL